MRIGLEYTTNPIVTLIEQVNSVTTPNHLHPPSPNERRRQSKIGHHPAKLWASFQQRSTK